VRDKSKSPKLLASKIATVGVTVGGVIVNGTPTKHQRHINDTPVCIRGMDMCSCHQRFRLFGVKG
jgi:hypothetical protein